MAQSPEATEETRLGPVRMLRAVFSGVGQLLLAADRFREEEADRLQAETLATGGSPDGAGPLDEPVDEPAQPRLLKITGNAEPSGASAKPAKAGASPAKRASRKTAAAQRPRFRSLDSTGNVRVLTEQDIADLAEDESDRHEPDRDQVARPTMRLTEVTSLPSFPTPAPAPDLPPAGTGSSFGLGTGTGSSLDNRLALPIADYDGLSVASLRARLRGLDPAQLRELADYETSHANRADVVTMFENRITKLAAVDES